MNVNDPAYLKGHLASANDRADQKLNRALADSMAQAGDPAVVGTFVGLLEDENPRIVFDVLITLGYLAEIKPGWLAGQLDRFFPFLNSRVNNHLWATMILLALLVSGNESRLFERLGEILDAMARGSVIARDHGIRLMVKLYADSRYCESVFALFREQLMMAPDNQLGQYALRIIDVIRDAHKTDVIQLLEMRMPEMEKETHRRRIARILKKYVRA